MVHRRTFLLLFVLAATVMMVVDRDNPPALTEDADVAFANNYYMQNFVMKTYDETGLLTQRITGDKLNQPRDSLENYIDKPNVLLLEGGQPTWSLTAQHAWLDGEKQNAKLEGALNIIQQPSPALELTTSSLALNLSTRVGSTDAATSLKQPDSDLKGIGLEASFNESGTFRLLSNVESTYAP